MTIGRPCGESMDYSALEQRVMEAVAPQPKPTILGDAVGGVLPIYGRALWTLRKH